MLEARFLNGEDFCSIGVPGERTHNCAMVCFPGYLPMENDCSIKGLDRHLLARVV